jgi:hypothetical protein
LMNIQTNILFTVHEGAPFRRLVLALTTYSQRGALL